MAYTTAMSQISSSVHRRTLTLNVEILVEILEQGHELGVLQEGHQQFEGVTAHGDGVLVLPKERCQCVLLDMVRFRDGRELLDIGWVLVEVFRLVCVKEVARFIVVSAGISCRCTRSW